MICQPTLRQFSCNFIDAVRPMPPLRPVDKNLTRGENEPWSICRAQTEHVHKPKRTQTEHKRSRSLSSDSQSRAQTEPRSDSRSYDEPTGNAHSISDVSKRKQASEKALTVLTPGPLLRARERFCCFRHGLGQRCCEAQLPAGDGDEIQGWFGKYII